MNHCTLLHTEAFRENGTLCQWRSQDEQVTWAHHGHTQSARNTHLLGDLRHAPAKKIFFNYTLWDRFWGRFGHKYNSSDLPVCSLHVRIKLAIAHVHNWPSLSTLFLPGHQRILITWAQARVCPGVATPLRRLCSSFVFVLCMWA